MYIRNLKYVKGNPLVDNWTEISDRLGEALMNRFTNYAKEKGYDVESYMDFVREYVVRKAD